MFKFGTHDSVSYAIRTMYDNDIYAANITDDIRFDPDNINHSDPYVGIIDFGSMVLWLLEVLIQVIFCCVCLYVNTIMYTCTIHDHFSGN